MKENPSDFTNHPFSSVFQNTETEVIARNLMVILERTGDKFREITEDEYRIERLNDGSFTESEMEYFRKILPYCKSADTAKLLSKAWSDKE